MALSAQKRVPPNLEAPNLEESTLQPASLDIWDSKYRLKTQDGRPVDQTVADTYSSGGARLGRR